MFQQHTVFNFQPVQFNDCTINIQFNKSKSKANHFRMTIVNKMQNMA
jgi:hypothetical protein